MMDLDNLRRREFVDELARYWLNGAVDANGALDDKARRLLDALDALKRDAARMKDET